MAEFTLFPTPIGKCGIAWQADTVTATQLPEQSTRATAMRLQRRAEATEGKPPSSIRLAIESITGLLEGSMADLSFIQCDFSNLPAVATRIYEAVREIPAGETRTYGDIALDLGDRSLAREVGRQLGRNPLPIIVPCHRVIGADGELTGFSAYGGIATKLRMLAIEGVLIDRQPDLFDC